MEKELNWDKMQNLIKDVMTSNQILNHINANKGIVITRDNYQVLPDIINLMKSSHRLYPVNVVNTNLGTSVLGKSLSIDTFIDQLIENFDLIYETPATDSDDIQYLIKFNSIEDCINKIKDVSNWCKNANWED